MLRRHVEPLAKLPPFKDPKKVPSAALPRPKDPPARPAAARCVLQEGGNALSDVVSSLDPKCEGARGLSGFSGSTSGPHDAEHFFKVVTNQEQADAELFALTRLRYCPLALALSLLKPSFSGQPHIVPLVCVCPVPHSKYGHIFVLKRLTPWEHNMHCKSLDRILLFMRQLLEVVASFFPAHLFSLGTSRSAWCRATARRSALRQHSL